MITLDTPLGEIKGTARFLAKLHKLDIFTVRDLLWYFPSRYDDFSTIAKIADLQAGEEATVRGVIINIAVRKTWRRRMFVVEATIEDDTGRVRATWFNQRFLLAQLKKGRMVSIAGKVALSGGGLSFSHPMYEFIRQDDVEEGTHTGRLLPIYPETKGFTSKAVRFLMKLVFDKVSDIPDFLPESVLASRNLSNLKESLLMLHFPETRESATRAKERFVFENLFLLQLKNIVERKALAGKLAHACTLDIEYVKLLISKLPFHLTLAQKRSLWEILQDIAKSHPMNRLLQGDVGSGKTVIAGLAAIIFGTYGKQSVFMAPTEVLARQHYETFKKLFSSFENGVGLITGAESRVWYGEGLESSISKKELLAAIVAKRVSIVVGTHSLIHNHPSFKELALVVIDEQHRFGVRQRATLVGNKKSGLLPHFLSMSATPIPRTLSLAIFGDLDISIIDELPSDRKAIVTKVVDAKNREKAYEFIREEVHKGRQVFVICPRIEEVNKESGIVDKFQSEVKNVKAEHEKLSKKIFPDLRVGMLHGKMKAKEKESVMRKFKSGDIDILVATSVIEVGIDVPNASIMVIEGAELFGLAQLYQFRGRVGRGAHQSYCLLFTGLSGATTKARLRSLITAKNGFELAEKDLSLRGPGEFLGNEQTGLPDFAMRALRDPVLLRDSRAAALAIINEDPKLQSYPLLREKLGQFGGEVHYE